MVVPHFGISSPVLFSCACIGSAAESISSLDMSSNNNGGVWLGSEQTSEQRFFTIFAFGQGVRFRQSVRSCAKATAVRFYKTSEDFKRQKHLCTRTLKSLWPSVYTTSFRHIIINVI